VTETVDASGNYWGSTAAATVKAAANNADGCDYTPWLGGGTAQNPGFAGDYSTLYVDDDSPQGGGGGGRIQEGLGLVSGSTINVLPGSYPGDLLFAAAFDKDGVVISGDAGDRPVLSGGVRFLNTGDVDGLTFENLYMKGVCAGGNAVFDLDNSGAVNDLTLHNCVIDGEDVSDRNGFTGNLLGSTLTVTDTELKDILGFAVMDIDSSSDYSPWGGNGLPFTDITFTGNYVHHCNGSVSLRGHTPTRTTQVTVADNTFTDIGGNDGETGEQWAAIEVNHADALDFYGNAIDGVVLGIWGEGQAVQLWDIGVLDMRDNQFTNCAQGVFIFGGSLGGSYGGPWPIPTGAIEYNNISGNAAYGLTVDASATGGPLDAEMNWWGDASGPGGDGPGTGDHVYGNLDHDPWIGKSPGGENIVCVPDPLLLNVASSGGQIAVNYLGGGGGAIYGYSLRLSWNDAIATTSAGAVTERTLLSDAGTTQFIAYPWMGAAAYGTSPVDIMLIAVRDKNNQPLSGFYEDDGEVQVDITNPVVTGVAIENLTLLHTNEYVKNGDDLELTATVTDDYGLSVGDIKANLSTLLLTGGSEVPAEDYTAPVATWTIALAGVTLTADGLKTVTVTAKDGLGNTGIGSDQITVDNLPPTPITGFDMAPGHEKLVMSWDNPSATDINFYGIQIRYDDWDDYPLYDDPPPLYPDDELAGEGDLYNDVGLVMSWDASKTDRDISYATAFVYDYALNYGPWDASAQDRSTNYWLGDVAQQMGSWGSDPGHNYNGLVNDADIDKLAGSYTLTTPSVPEAECDVGPTHDHSRVGIPEPDDFIGFEDLMIFAMNYGVVSPRVVPYLPDLAASNALGLELVELGFTDTGDLEVALRLTGNADEVKGLSAAIAYEGTELEHVTTRMSDHLALPVGDLFFWHGADEGLVLVDLAVLGTGVTLGGSGDVAILTFRILSDGYTLEFADARLRGAENQSLEADLEGCASRPEVPLAFRLAGNLPNPFNPKTAIAYHVPHEAAVTIVVYDVSGRVVRTLVDGVVEPGRHEVVWDGRSDRGDDVGSGVYFCTMEAESFHGSHKMMLLK